MNVKKRTERSSIKPRRVAATTAPRTAVEPAPVERQREFQLTRANRAVVTILQDRDIVTNVEPVSRLQLLRVRRELFKQPGNQALLERYAYLLYACFRIHEAIEVYERLLADFTPSSDALYYLGCCHLILFDMRSAQRVWGQLGERFPDSQLVHKVERNLARLRELTGGGANGATKKAPTSVRQLLKRIEGALDNVVTRPDVGDPTAEVEAAVAEAVGAEVEQRGREVLFFSLDEIGGVGALDTLESLVGEEPDNVDFLDWAAFVHYSNGNLAKAAEYYRRLLDLTEANPFAFYYIGEILFRSGQAQKAFAYWDLLDEHYPGHQLTEKARRTKSLVAATSR